MAVVNSSAEVRLVEHPGVLSLTAPTAARVLSPIRRLLREFMLVRDARPEVIDDVELAASELATNVIRHTESPSISLRLARTADAWVLDVADADRVPPLDEISPPPPTDPTGRGLIVVSSVMDEVRVVELTGGSVVRCIRRQPSTVTDDVAPAERLDDAPTTTPSTSGRGAAS